MNSVHRFISEPEDCPYLPDRKWQLDYDIVNEMTLSEFSDLVRSGWRRFGFSLFRPQCPTCKECQPIRVPVATFSPDRSLKRAAKGNQDLKVEIGQPSITREIYSLYIRHHLSRSQSVGWRIPSPDSSLLHLSSLCEGPLRAQQWNFRLDGQLVAVCFVDVLDDGLSAVYSFYDPELESRSLGTFMILSLIERARIDHLPMVYLGYFIEGCRSMRYKARFRPHEILGADGQWYGAD